MQKSFIKSMKNNCYAKIIQRLYVSGKNGLLINLEISLFFTSNIFDLIE